MGRQLLQLGQIRFISLVDFWSIYGFRVMLIGTTLVGLFAAVLGSLLYLRKQSLISDVIGHSAIAGVAGGFAFATAVLSVEGRSMVVLTVGATVASVISVLIANWVSKTSKVGIDAAMAICLALFYGGGMVGMKMIYRSKLPNRAGISSYVFGNAATIRLDDVKWIAIFGAISLLVMLVFWKELKLFIFDPVAATMAGFSYQLLNPLMLGAATLAIVIGVKAVGVILMVAFAILPGAAARQWTNRMNRMVTLAAVFGSASAAVGCYLATCMGAVPTGPVVVLLLFAIFLISILFSPNRSVIRVSIKRKQMRRQLALQAANEGVG